MLYGRKLLVYDQKTKTGILKGDDVLF